MPGRATVMRAALVPDGETINSRRMEVFFVLLGLLVVGGGFLGWVLGIAGWLEARRLRQDVAALRQALAAAGLRVAEASVPFAAPAEVVPPAPAPEPAVAPAPAAEPATETFAAPPPRRPGLEEALTQRWGVWLGGAALLLAGVFLVRTAVEEGWLGPAERCVLAAVLGGALILVAEYLRRRPNRPNLPFPDQAPGALAAGGVAILFGAAYGAAVLYALVPPLIGFALLAAAALVGILLALLQGPVTAAIGIAGAYLTPALVQTTDPSLPGLFAYLLAVTVAALGVVRQVGAGWLGWAATVAGAVWVVVGGAIAGGGAGLWAPALFVPATAAAHLLLVRMGRDSLWPAVPVAILAGAGLLLVPANASLAPAIGLLLLTPVCLVAGALRPGLDRLPWLAAAAGLLMLLAWPVADWAPEEQITIEGVVQAILPRADWAPAVLWPFLAMAGALAGMHALAGLWQERRAPHPLRWAALPAAVPVLTLLVAYARVRGFETDTAWAFAALALAAALVGLAMLAARSPERAGAYAAGAVAALALGAAMLLQAHWLTLAVALFLPPLAWIEGRSGLAPLRRVALAVAAVVLVRLLLNERVFEYEFGATPVLNGLLAAYGIPAASFALSAWMFRRRADDTTVAVLEAGACGFLVALVLLELRHAATGGSFDSDLDWTFREAAAETFCLGLLATLLRLVAGARPVIGWAWRGIQGAAVLLGTLLLFRNPAFDPGETILPWPVFNELLFAFALPAAFAALAARAWVGSLAPRLLGLYALAAAFVWVSLTVRHRFHPVEMSLDLEPISPAELWAYSGAWLAFGAALISLGIRNSNRELRLAALAVLGLTIGKVFLVDMAELGGLWRVLSFLGLGLALIALGWVYRRFVVEPPAQEAVPAV